YHLLNFKYRTGLHQLNALAYFHKYQKRRLIIYDMRLATNALDEMVIIQTLTRHLPNLSNEQLTI
ncbi:MAG: hypothetical protein ACRD93_06175, partial [Nitrososphaeraceae archaeon]